ncbi:glutamine amidotransferase [Gordonia jinghuaiqii]|uniref:DJ-1/PfpI family protein n=1 Tax=Gordonia jinghuaiqii TaxID=2758710 RepID=A0A7D7LQS3_9ACTN|nr:DJ-1/PfpI family protein [Gordonia jinghuaiqii]MCR5979211.1 glutamine amidotransferase [Gordonia jinghuaiqii]QMT01005.1 DJ-1/PfpI family protein [Gordonia jinghuaiqii]
MKTVHLALYPTLADWEFGYVAAGINNPEYQREPGAFRIVTVGATHDPVRTIGGITMVPDTTLAEVSPTDSAMLVLPGAQIWDANDAFVDAARRWVDATVPVAGICGATVGLARGGLLDDRRHTSNAPEQLTPTGYAGAAHYVDAPAVTDRGVITAAAVAPVDFAREVFALLGVYQPAVLDAWYRLYGHQDPSGFYALQGER